MLHLPRVGSLFATWNDFNGTGDHMSRGKMAEVLNLCGE
jgi:hypothetical protein